IEVIEVAEKLIEAVRGRKMLVTVAEVVLAELAGGLTVCLKNVCDAGIMRPETKFCTRQTDLGEAGANRRLSGDESSRPAVQPCWPYQSVKTAPSLPIRR